MLIIDFSRSYLNVSKRWLVHLVVSATISRLPCQPAKLPGESRDRQTSKERRRVRRMRSRRSRSCDCNPESTQREREGGGAAAMRTSVTDDLGTFCTFQIAAEERNFIDCITLPSTPSLHSIPIPPFLCPSSSSSSLLQLDAVIALQRAGESHASRDVVQRARPLIASPS